jgi:hypothetical protein
MSSPVSAGMKWWHEIDRAMATGLPPAEIYVSRGNLSAFKIASGCFLHSNLLKALLDTA